MDPAKEPELLWIAEEGMNAPLPLGYSSHQMDNGEMYFYHDETKKRWVTCAPFKSMSSGNIGVDSS